MNLVTKNTCRPQTTLSNVWNIILGYKYVQTDCAWNTNSNIVTETLEPKKKRQSWEKCEMTWKNLERNKIEKY